MELRADSEAAAALGLAGVGSQMGGELALLMDELAHGVLLATVAGRVLHANHAAQRELARQRVLHARDGELRACAAADAAILQDALARVGQGKRSLIGLHGDAAGGMFTVAVLPLMARQPGQHPKAALLFARATVCEDLMLAFFARRYALTATEEQVLGILSQGCSAPQVAARLHVAVSTVRSHVRSLCAKTRSRGVRELVNRLAVLPPLGPACRHPVVH